MQTTLDAVRPPRAVGAAKGNGVNRPRRPRRLSGRNALWLVPFLAFAIVFGVVPFAQVIRMSFSEVKILQGQFAWSASGFTNYAVALADPRGWQAIGNTLLFVVATSVGTLVIGTVIALLVNRAVWTLPLARNIMVWPAIVAPVVVSLIWLLILSPTAGGINKVLGSLGLPAQQWLNDSAGAMTAIILVDVWHWSPVVFLFVYTALQAIDASTLEAARIDGASEGQIIRRVILPILVPTLGAVAVVRIIMGVKAFDEMYLLTAGGPNGATTLVSLHIKELFFDQLRFGQAAAYGMVVVILTAIILGVYLFAQSRKEKAA